MGRIGTANIDGGSRGNPGPAAWAFVLKDDATGEIIELSDAMGTATNNVAEYTALLELLDYCLASDFEKLKVHSDSELMVRQIEGRYKVKAPELIPLFADAKEMIAKLKSFQITHVKREFNKRADELCNISLDAANPSKAKAKGKEKAKQKDEERVTGEKDAKERCLRLIEFYAEDWRNGSPVKPFSELLLKELTALLKSETSC